MHCAEHIVAIVCCVLLLFYKRISRTRLLASHKCVRRCLRGRREFNAVVNDLNREIRRALCLLTAACTVAHPHVVLFTRSTHIVRASDHSENPPRRRWRIRANQLRASHSSLNSTRTAHATVTYQPHASSRVRVVFACFPYSVFIFRARHR